MKIVLLYAMHKEIESLLPKEQGMPMRTLAGVDFYAIRENVVAVTGGVGKVNAAMATQLSISLFSPDLLINCGVAGCFENVPIGTILLADGFVQHDVDTTECGDPIGLVSTVNVVDFPTHDLALAKKAMDRAGIRYLCGKGATGDWFAKAGKRAEWVRDTFRPLFIEMEGGAVAQVCMRNHVRFMAVKSVSDCLFGNDQYHFNFPTAMRDLNDHVMRWLDALEGEMQKETCAKGE